MDLKKCDITLQPSQIGTLRTIGEVASELGERCYLVGGAVRDCLLGKPNKDLDIVCSNSERVVTELASRLEKQTGKKPTVATFKKFGTHQIKMLGEEVEFVDPRKETYAYQSIKPEVSKGDFADDAMRRDFTVNALYLGIQKDDWMKVVDLTGKGVEDLKNNLLRTPLDPEVTFRDDPTRLLRLSRFNACKGFDIDPTTKNTAKKSSPEVKRVPFETIKQLLENSITCNGYIRSLDELGLLKLIVPEFDLLKGLKQGPHHKYDAGEHTLRVVDDLPKEYKIRLAGLLHDLGKYDTQQAFLNLHGHEEYSTNKALEIADRLKLSNDDKKYVVHIVEHHMDLLNLMNSFNDKNIPSGRAIRTFMSKNEGYEYDLIEFARADITATGFPRTEDHRKLDIIKSLIRDEKARMGEKPFKLQITGKDVMDILGIKEGVAVGKTLSMLKDKVIEGSVENKREDLLRSLKAMKVSK